jgi:K+-sensing histidine kinase KdpD
MGISMHSGLGIVGRDRSVMRRWLTPITMSLLLLALTTTLLWLADASLRSEHLIFIYFVPTALIAIRYGSVSAMLVTIGSCVAGVYFLYAPRFSFAVDDPLDMMELILFSLLALLASQVVSGFANDSDVAKRPRRGGAPSLRTRWPSVAALRTHDRG